MHLQSQMSFNTPEMSYQSMNLNTTVITLNIFMMMMWHDVTVLFETSLALRVRICYIIDVNDCIVLFFCKHKHSNVLLENKL